MSANKRRRSNSNNNNSSRSSSQMATAERFSAAKDDCDAVVDGGINKFDASSGDDGFGELLDMPRVCRCCCKGDMELLSLFEANGETVKQTTQQQRRRKTTTTALKEATATTEPQQRNSDNPVEYALSGARSSMSAVREEMHVWMLNISQNDGLPQEICRQCAAQFVMVSKFRRRCLRVQQRLLAYARDIADRKLRLPAKQDELESTTEDYLHLPESQTERKRRLWLGLEPTAPQPEPTKTDVVAGEAPAPKVRRLQLRTRSTRTASLPSSRLDTEPSTPSTSRSTSQQSELRVRTRTPQRSPSKRIQMPWKTKAARKELSDTWTNCRTDRENSGNATEPSSGQTSPEHLSDLSVHPCRGFECDGQSCSSSSTFSSCSLTAGPADQATKSNAKLRFPPKRRSSKRQLLGMRRGRRARATIDSVPLGQTKHKHFTRRRQSTVKYQLCEQVLEQLSNELKEKEAVGEQPGEMKSVEKLTAEALERLNKSHEEQQLPVAEEELEKQPSEAEANAATIDEGAETLKPEEVDHPATAELIIPQGEADQEKAESVNSQGEAEPEKAEIMAPCVEAHPEAGETLNAEEKAQLDLVEAEQSRSPSPASSDSDVILVSSPTPPDSPEEQHAQESSVLKEEEQPPANAESPLVVNSEEVGELQTSTKPETETQKEMPDDVQMESETSNVVEESQEAVNDNADSADSTVQFEELISSEQSRLDLTPEVPAVETEVELELTYEPQPDDDDDDDSRSELIVSIPLEKLDDDLQRKLCTSTESLAELVEPEVDAKEPPEADDVNNNGNGENFCQSATADSFNAAVALATNQIEAEPNGGDTKQPPPDDDMASLERLAELQTNQAVDEVQPARPANASMDFLAEFEKHCEKTLKLQPKKQTTPPPPAPPPPAPVDEQLKLVKAKQQLEVEMNDVETTLHGILNEMQDQHLYTPVCAQMDEFLTPADYGAMTETESPTPAEPQPAEEPQGEAVKEGYPFDSSNFSNELIGFQNDMPCFENIEPAPETVAAQSLQLELTQLLNELQPAQPVPQQQQQQQRLPAESISYETLYPAPTPAAPSKLQVIQMSPQETLWQAQSAAASQAGAQLQWSTVGGLEAIKTTPVQAGLDSLDGSGTTTYYISASDLYQSQLQQQTEEGYALLDSNENYVLEQQQQQQQQQHQQQQQQQQQHHPQQQQTPQQQQQPIMILIQQPELQQPVASASNPQQAPLHISYGNELHAAYPQQHQQHQQQQQTPQQQVQNSVLGLPAAVPAPTRGRPPMLKCRFCQNGPRFSSSLEYSRHIIDLHPAVAPFNCPHCPLAFAGRSKRSQHILSHHMVQQFHCGQCSQMLPSQRALDLHLQRFHMPLPTEPTRDPAGVGGVRLDDVQLQMANSREPPKLMPLQQLQHPMRQHQQHQGMPHMSALEPQASSQQPRRTRILCCPDCEDCSSASGHHHGLGHASFEELSNLQPPPTVLTPPSTIASLPSPQPAPHITLPSPEQSEPDSTTATLRQFRKRCPAAAATATTAATAAMGATMLNTVPSPSPSSSPSSSTMETAACLQLGKLRSNHQCVVCEKSFTNIIALRKHQQLAHDSQTTMPWVCGICKRGYRKRTDMDNHMKSHEPKGRPYECNECWVRFPEFKQLAMHKFTVHELIKPHTCDECGKQFGTESALKTHIKFHGERGFDCEECDELFPSIKELRKHRRSHNRDLFYKCDKCPRTFQHFTSYRAHINTHLPMGVFLNDKIPSSLSCKLNDSPTRPAMIEETSLPMTPLSNCNGGNIEDCPGSVELVESSMAPTLEMIVNTP